MADITAEKQSLDDLMVAMDVVDTLRHRQGMVDRELDSEGRRERLIKKLRGIYADQGIKVSDTVLAEGVRALEEDRFRYQAPGQGISTRLARLYIRRGRGFKPFLLFVAIVIGAQSYEYFSETLPERRLLENLPAQISKTYRGIQKLAVNDEIVAQGQSLSVLAGTALDNQKARLAEHYFNELQRLYNTLQQTYRVRITSRPGEPSGVWRLTDSNASARNYYLIVEAVSDDGKRLQLPISNEENNQVEQVDTWGIRVDKATFQRIADDKNDDGIIQDNIIGEKSVGTLKPTYKIATSGATITRW